MLNNFNLPQVPDAILKEQTTTPYQSNNPNMDNIGDPNKLSNIPTLKAEKEEVTKTIDEISQYKPDFSVPSKPAQGLRYEANLLSINLGTDASGKEMCYGMLSMMNVDNTKKTYSFRSYRSYIIIQCIWIKALSLVIYNKPCVVQGNLKEKNNRLGEYLLFAEDMEIKEFPDLRNKAYAKELPIDKMIQEVKMGHTKKTTLMDGKKEVENKVYIPVGFDINKLS